jgi:hypothetical protein
MFRPHAIRSCQRSCRIHLLVSWSYSRYVPAILCRIYFQQIYLKGDVPTAIWYGPITESSVKSIEQRTSQNEGYIVSVVFFSTITAIFSTNRQFDTFGFHVLWFSLISTSLIWLVTPDVSKVCGFQLRDLGSILLSNNLSSCRTVSLAWNWRLTSFWSYLLSPHS